MYDVDTRAKLRKQVYKKKLHYKFSSDILKSFSWQFLRKDLFLPEVSVACKWFEYIEDVGDETFDVEPSSYTFTVWIDKCRPLIK